MSVRVRAKRDDFLHEFVWLRDRADEVVFTYAKKNHETETAGGRPEPGNTRTQECREATRHERDPGQQTLEEKKQRRGIALLRDTLVISL